MCVDPNIYANPPTELQFAGQLGSAGITIPLSGVLSLGEGGNTTAMVGVATCVPTFGLTYEDLPVTMPCNALADMIEAQNQVAALLNNGSQAALNQAALMRMPHMSPLYNVLRPNMWVYNEQLYLQPSGGMGRSGFAGTGNIRLETVLSFSGDFLGYVSRVPAGQLRLRTDNPQMGVAQSNTTYCSAGWSSSQPSTIQGQVAYSVCNPTNTSAQSASYSVVSRCGLATLISSENDGSFLPGPDDLGRSMFLINSPSQVNLIGVQPGKCKGTSDGGFLYFQGTFSVAGSQPSPTLADLTEDGGLQCIVEVRSSQTLVPGTMVVARQLLACNIITYEGSNPIVVPSTPFPTPHNVVSTPTATSTTIPSPEPTPTINKEVTWVVLSVGTVVGFIAICTFLIAFVIVCCTKK